MIVYGGRSAVRYDYFLSRLFTAPRWFLYVCGKVPVPIRYKGEITEYLSALKKKIMTGSGKVSVGARDYWQGTNSFVRTVQYGVPFCGVDNYY